VANVMLSEDFVVKVNVLIHYHSAFLFQSAPLTTSICVTETIKMNVPLILIPLCTFICVLHVVYLCVCVCVCV
jgi:hypothetical protein